jgi:hypothetical protein
VARAAGIGIDRIRRRRRREWPRLDRLLAPLIVRDRPLAGPVPATWAGAACAPVSPDRLPPGTDWAWRPQGWVAPLSLQGLALAHSGSGLGEGVRLFHDGDAAEVAVMQRASRPGSGRPPFALDLETRRFGGRFLSLAIELPEAAARGLGPARLFRLDLAAEGDRPAAIYARLNLCQGPNVTPLLRHVPPGAGRAAVFDLAYAGLEPAPIDRLWLDLILEAPAMTRFALGDVAFCRHPRAPL